MIVLYFDCSSGISGDMLRRAVTDLSGKGAEIERILSGVSSGTGSVHTHERTCGCRHSHDMAEHGRSLAEVKHIIEHSNVPAKAAEYASAIYDAIAEAEAAVHGETPDTVHFHEVGRDEAVKNALGTALAVESVNPDMIVTSALYDGCGTVVCSHGEIPVPVPAVKALMTRCSYEFRTADVDTEMVTPSGLAGLIGIGAEPCGTFPEGTIIKRTEAGGGRSTGRPGLKAYLIEV